MNTTLLDAWCASPARCEVARLAGRGAPAFAVGGAVRDVLLGRAPYDWDVVSPEAAALARTVADALDGTLVWLHDAPETCRVVVGAHSADVPREELDFSDLRGTSLEEDLRARDFTINSLAWPLGAPDGTVVDPCGGRQDLTAGLIRANSAAVLAEDPLRCLRAYRIAAELGFTVEQTTAAWIRRHAPDLRRVSGERVGAEFVRLVLQRGLPGRVEELNRAGVLAAVAPELPALRGVTQGGYHHLDVWGHTLLVVEHIEDMEADPSAVFPRAAASIREYLQAPEARARVKLAALLHDIAKPATRSVQEDGIRFLGHESLGSRMAVRICGRLRLPRGTRRAVGTLVHMHMRPIMLLEATEPVAPTLSAVRRLFRDCAPDGPGVFMLAAADVLSCRGPATDAVEQQARVRMLDSMVAGYREWQREQSFQPLLRGRDLIDELGLEPGPHFGVILEAVEQAQVDGEISSRWDALDMARRVMGEGVSHPDGE